MEYVEERQAVRLNVLGALECWAGERRILLGGAKAERVLGYLLLSHNRSVPVARLVEAVWGAEPPSTAAHQIRKTISTLRRLLPGGAELLRTDGAGYRAVVSAGRLDLREFEELLRAASEAQATGRPKDAGAWLRAALDLWRGPVLDGLDGEVIDVAANVLVETRLAAVEHYARLRLEIGQLDGLAPYLRQYVDAHPLRESLRELLMTALYRTGRHADALEEYVLVRQLLAEELGADPSPQLARLHEAILRQSPELSGAPAAPLLEPAAPAGPDPDPVRCTLPYDLPDFTGRQDTVRRILTALGNGRRIITIDGMGGSGKTALAVHVASRIAERYPDGQLFLDLLGFTPGHAPLHPLEALDHLLRSLGVPSDRIPEGLPERRALWRSVTANRRLLVVLDNVRDSAQVQPLLLGTEDSATIITSRTRLVEIDGAEWYSVGSLSMEDSMELLCRVLGDDHDDVEARTLLASMCGGLPLALRIASARLRNRPQWTVRYLVDRMRSEARTLTELRVGERSVAASLQLSYRAMSDTHRAAFRLLGWHPGADFDVHSAAALLGTDVQAAEALLEELLDVNLLEQHTLGRYTLHDLVRWFARDLRGNGSADREEDSVQRLLDHYLLTLERACDLLFPGRTRHPVELPEECASLPDLDSEREALRWLDDEYPALRDAAQLAFDVGLDLHAAYLPRGMAFYLNLRGWWTEFRDVEMLAVRAARRLDDPLLLRISLTNLGLALWKLGDLRGCLTQLDEALALAEQMGEPHGVAAALGRIGMCYSSLGQYEEALKRLDRALSLNRRLDSRREEAETLANAASALNCLGRHAEAAEAALRAVRLDRSLGERDHEIYALTELAVAHLGMGRPDLAVDRLADLGGESDGLRQPGTVGLMLAYRAEAYQRLGRTTEADACTVRVLKLVEVSGAIRRAEIENVLGRIYRRRHDHAAALRLHRSAYRRSAAMDLRVEMARAQAGVAAAADAVGDTVTAAAAREAARDLFDGIGVPEDCRWPD
ncbi:BTAD domain-containing putative transcriptional regulator [Streptomyces sp. NPDC058964]|uniref:AfsR/SARP family transcriptional regulator n=1 Tax=Streptomyces sp. NPDC058964 TaxID=3346681 RepID=UPI00367FE84C